jgi:hypothetical protein
MRLQLQTRTAFTCRGAVSASVLSLLTMAVDWALLNVQVRRASTEDVRGGQKPWLLNHTRPEKWLWESILGNGFEKALMHKH